MKQSKPVAIHGRLLTSENPRVRRGSERFGNLQPRAKRVYISRMKLKDCSRWSSCRKPPIISDERVPPSIPPIAHPHSLSEPSAHPHSRSSFNLNLVAREVRAFGGRTRRSFNQSFTGGNHRRAEGSSHSRAKAWSLDDIVPFDTHRQFRCYRSRRTPAVTRRKVV